MSDDENITTKAHDEVIYLMEELASNCRIYDAPQQLPVLTRPSIPHHGYWMELFILETKELGDLPNL